MKEIERLDDYECSIADAEYRGSFRDELRELQSRWDQIEKEYNRNGFDVICIVNKQNGIKETDYYFLKSADGYSVQSHGKSIVTARTRDELAKEAFTHGIIGYFTRVEIGKGKAAAERVKNDPQVRNLLEQYNLSGD